MREDQDFIRFAAGGGSFGSSYVRADDPQTLAKYVRRIAKTEGEGSVSRILDTPKKLLDMWEKIGSASENAARVQLYAKRVKGGASHLEATFEGRDLLDFTKRGSAGSVQFLIQMIPFMNARMQGIYRLGQSAALDPKSFALKGGLIALASMVLWAYNRDRKEWKELEDWDKRTYYHFWVGDKHFRIPKPFEVGAIFSSMFESAADTLFGEEDAAYFADFLKETFLETFALNPVPQAVRPVVEQWANRSAFTGRPLEPEHMKRLKPGARYDPWTSETLKLAGKLGVPPKRAEALIRGYLATFGTFILGLSDIMVQDFANFPDKPKKRIGDYPLVGRFVKERRAPRHSKYVTRLYDIFKELDQTAGTVNFYLRTGDIKQAQLLVKKEPRELIMRKGMASARQQLSRINKRMRMVMTNRKLTPEQKRKQVDNLTALRNQFAYTVYTAYTAFQKTGK
jgi:hypothetical protein